MMMPRFQRLTCTNTQIEERSLCQLQNNLKSFRDNGSRHSHAKHYNNVIHEYLFSIPLSQVVVPGLHLSLGIFLRLFTMFEAALHELDLKIALEISRSSCSEIEEAPFECYVTKLKDAQRLEAEASDLYEKAESYAEQALWMSIQTEDDKDQSLVYLRKEISQLQNTANEKMKQAEKISEENQLKLNDALCVKQLDKALQGISVKRQAYFSHSFVGNHVHKCCKEVNIEKLCRSCNDIVVSKVPSLQREATMVSNKYEQAFKLFAVCRADYDSDKVFTNSDVETLENNINNFMSYYRENWPSSSVTPKLHILEDHVPQFIRKWGIGLGFMGEQGFESIHSNFNLRQAEQRGAVSAVQRLEIIMRRHLMAVHPENTKLKPVVKKRKLNWLQLSPFSPPILPVHRCRLLLWCPLMAFSHLPVWGD